ncbi:Protein Tax-1 [Borealophlyctis nickersoniae]|nr:Protein Tax-1 [Borealophlyctis nickersoniae]
MYKVEILPSDILRDAAIQRRRQLDEERKKRIFDPKLRVLGIDVKALEEQIRMKNEIKDVEREREEAFDKSMKHTNTVLQHLDAAAVEAARKHQKELDEFRKTQQPAHLRRDYDLSDPHALRHQLPPRTWDGDMRCGVSACQKFEGEDLASEARKKLQKMQMRVWAEQGAWEKKKERVREDEERRNYEQYQADIAAKTTELQKAVDRARMEQAIKDRDMNRRLAEERRQKELLDAQHEQSQNKQEVETQMNGVFLTERPDVFCIGGGHQVRVDEFKGITPEQREYILQMQERQRQEAEARRDRERQEEHEWAVQEAANLRAAMLLQRERARMERGEATRIRMQNAQKAQEDHLRRQYMDNVLYTNAPTPEYFAQFNTTSR